MGHAPAGPRHSGASGRVRMQKGIAPRLAARQAGAQVGIFIWCTKKQTNAWAKQTNAPAKQTNARNSGKSAMPQVTI
jgi:hypothetical protein